jgi:VCBS repeat-containing protein
MIKLKKLLIGMLLLSSSLFAALSDVGTITSPSHGEGEIVDNNTTITFQWTNVTGADKYCYIIDTNSSTSANYVLNDTYLTCGSNPEHGIIGTGATTSITKDVNVSGDYYLHILKEDNDGNTSISTTSTFAVKIDIDALSVNGVTNNKAGRQDKSVVLTAQETGKIYYTFGDGTDVNTSVSTFVEDNESAPSVTLDIAVNTTVNILFIDELGNVGTKQEYVINSISNNLPILKTSDDGNITGKTVATKRAYNLSELVTDLNVSGDGFSRYDLGSGAVSINTLIDIENYASQQHTLSIKGCDNYTCQATATDFSFTVDNVAPSGLKISANGVDYNESNSSTHTFADDFDLNISVSDANVTYYKFGADGDPSKASTLYTGVFNTVSSDDSKAVDNAEKTFVIEFISYDSVNNKTDIQSATYTIDKKAPILTVPADANFSSEIADVNITVDNQSTVYYQINHTASVTTPSDESGFGSWTEDNGSLIPLTTYKVGQGTTSMDNGQVKYLHVSAIDTLGNIATVKTTAFTYLNSSTRELNASSTSITFGDTQTNGTSNSQVTISNTGTLDITLSSSDFVFSNSDFNITNTSACIGTIAKDTNATCLFTFTPSSKSTDINGTVNVTYSGTTESNLTISLNGVGLGSAPVFELTELNATEDTNLTGNLLTDLNVADTDGDDFNFSVQTDVSNGTLMVDNNGSFWYQADGNYSGTDWFVVRAVSDINSSDENITINIAAVNDMPVLHNIIDLNLSANVDTNVTTNEDGNGTIEVNASDIDSDTLEYNATSSDGNVTFVFADNNITLLPAVNWYGEADINVTVTDGNLTANNLFSFIVNSVNDAPVFGTNIFDTNVSIEEDTNTTLEVNASDIDGDTLDYNATSSDGNVTFIFVDNNITLVPAENWYGEANITVVIDDGNTSDNNATSTFKLTVTAENDAPVESTPIDVGPAIVDQVKVFDLTQFFTDVDDTNLTYESNETLSWLTIDSNGTLTTDTNSSDVGTYAVYLNVKDDSNASVLTSFSIDVLAQPIISNIDVNTSRARSGEDVNITIYFSEDVNITTDGNLTLTLNNGDEINVSLSDGSTITASNGISTIYTISGDDNESISVVDMNVSGSTITGNQTGQVFLKTTVDIGDFAIDTTKPVFTSALVIETDENNKTIGHTIVVTDLDENVTVELLEQNDSAHFDFNETTWVLDFNATKNFEDNNSDNNFTIVFRATDEAGNKQEQNVSVLLQDVNEKPVISNMIDLNTSLSLDTNITINEDENRTIEINASDVDAGDTLDYNATSSDGNVTFIFADNNITLLPAANWYGEADINVSVTDDGNLTTNSVFTFIVNAVNDAPVIGVNTFDSNVTIDEDTNTTIEVNASDVDNPDLNYTATTTDGNVTFIYSDNNITIVPTANWNGEANITIMVHDGNVSENNDTTTFKFNVNSLPDAPIVTGDFNGTIGEDTDSNLTGVVTIEDADIGENELNQSTISTSQYGTFYVDQNGSWIYDMNDTAVQALGGGVNVNDIVTITTHDGNKSVDLNITIIGLNDESNISGQTTLSITEDNASVITSVMNISDKDSGEDRLAGASAGTKAGAYGVFVVDVNGTWTYELNISANGIQQLNSGDSLNDVITVTTYDGNATDELNVTINGTNDAPYTFTKDGNSTIYEDNNATFTLTIVDVDNNSSEISILTETNTTDGIFEINTTTLVLTYRPDNNFIGQDNFALVAFDGDKNSSKLDFNITVLTDTRDSDGDGISDKNESRASNLYPTSVDTDNDGTPDYLDTDSDGDTIEDSVEGVADSDGDGIADFRETDSDNDGLDDKYEADWSTSRTDGSDIVEFAVSSGEVSLLSIKAVPSKLADVKNVRVMWRDLDVYASTDETNYDDLVAKYNLFSTTNDLDSAKGTFVVMDDDTVITKTNDANTTGTNIHYPDGWSIHGNDTGVNIDPATLQCTNYTTDHRLGAVLTLENGVWHIYVSTSESDRSQAYSGSNPLSSIKPNYGYMVWCVRKEK